MRGGHLYESSQLLRLEGQRVVLRVVVSFHVEGGLEHTADATARITNSPQNAKFSQRKLWRADSNPTIIAQAEVTCPCLKCLSAISAHAAPSKHGTYLIVLTAPLTTSSSIPSTSTLSSRSLGRFIASTVVTCSSNVSLQQRFAHIWYTAQSAKFGSDEAETGETCLDCLAEKVGAVQRRAPCPKSQPG
jgi:hypothetical protein